jgi:hypothetical protein
MLRIKDRPACNFKKLLLELPIDDYICAIVLKVKHLGTKSVLCFFT